MGPGGQPPPLRESRWSVRVSTRARRGQCGVSGGRRRKVHFGCFGEDPSCGRTSSGKGASVCWPAAPGRRPFPARVSCPSPPSPDPLIHLWTPWGWGAQGPVTSEALDSLQIRGGSWTSRAAAGPWRHIALGEVGPQGSRRAPAVTRQLPSGREDGTNSRAPTCQWCPRGRTAPTVSASPVKTTSPHLPGSEEAPGSQPPARPPLGTTEGTGGCPRPDFSFDLCAQTPRRHLTRSRPSRRGRLTSLQLHHWAACHLACEETARAWRFTRRPAGRRDASAREEPSCRAGPSASTAVRAIFSWRDSPHL